MPIYKYLPEFLLALGSLFAVGGIYNCMWWMRRDRWEPCSGSIQKIVKGKDEDGVYYYPIITGTHRSAPFRVRGPTSRCELEVGSEVIVTHDPGTGRYFVDEGGISTLVSTITLMISGSVMIYYGWELLGER